MDQNPRNPCLILRHSQMGGAPTPKWDPIGFDPQHLISSSPPFQKSVRHAALRVRGYLDSMRRQTDELGLTAWGWFTCTTSLKVSFLFTRLHFVGVQPCDTACPFVRVRWKAPSLTASLCASLHVARPTTKQTKKIPASGT